MNYIKVTFELSPVLPAREILYADIDQLGFESVLDTEKGAEAYIPKPDFEKSMLSNLMVSNLPNVSVKWDIEEIEKQNWNATWESQFAPITIHKNCIIRAPFHTPENVKFDIIISPKMSFGTGHHETTYLMSKRLFDLDLKEKKVLDMGCGTGVLAIIASKLGAINLLAVDIEDWACENTVENCSTNQIANVEVINGDAEMIKNRKFNVILANINRNILINDMPIYSDCLEKGGTILFSGFYTTDLELIQESATKNGLKFDSNIEKNNWTMAQFTKI